MTPPPRCAIVLLLAILAACVAASTTAMAAGPTVLTVVGAIENANRGPLDPFTDALLNSHDIEFDKGYTFDRDALAGLGMHRITTRYPGSDRTVEVEGPLLRDVLKQAGATGTSATVMALDGYAAEIPMSELATWPVVLALKSGGAWLAVGGRGPAWVVYPVSDIPALADHDDAKWVWAAFFIRVE